MQNSYQPGRLVWSGDQTGNGRDYQFVSAPRPLGVNPIEITVDGKPAPAEGGEWLIDSILRVEELAHVCYHPQMGPIQSCDTCMVEVKGRATVALHADQPDEHSGRATRYRGGGGLVGGGGGGGSSAEEVT